MDNSVKNFIGGGLAAVGLFTGVYGLSGGQTPISQAEANALLRQADSTNALSPVQEAIIATFPELTERKVGSIVDVARYCAGLHLEGGQSAEIAMIGMPVFNHDGSLHSFIAKEVRCGFSADYGNSLSSIHAEVTGLINQLLLIQRNLTSNPLGRNNNGVDIFSERTSGSLLSYGIDPDGRVYTNFPSGEPINMVELLSDREFVEQVNQAIRDQGLCGYISPIQAAATAMNKPYSLGFTDELGEKWEIEICENTTYGPYPTTEQSINFDNLPPTLEDSVIRSFMSYVVPDQNGGKNYPFTPDSNGDLILQIPNEDGSNERVVLYSAGGNASQPIGAYIIGFKSSSVSSRLPDKNGNQSQNMHQAAQALTVLLTIASLAFLYTANKPKVDLVVKKALGRDPEKKVPDFEYENIGKYADAVISLTTTEQFNGNIIGLVEDLNNLSRLLNLKRGQDFSRQLNAVLAQKLKLEEPNALVQNALENIKSYNPGTINQETSLGYILINRYLTSLLPEPDDRPGILKFNKALLVVQGRFGSTFGFNELKISTNEITSAPKQTFTLSVNGDIFEIQAHDELDGLLTNISTDSKIQARIKKSAKEILPFIKTALNFDGNVEAINGSLSSMEKRIVDRRVSKDSFHIIYSIVDKNQDTLGYLSIEVNSEEGTVEIDYSDEQGVQSRRNAEKEKLGMELIPMAQENEQAASILDISVGFASDISKLVNNFTDIEEFNTIRESIQGWSKYFENDSRVKKEIINQLAERIELGQIEIIEDTSKTTQPSKDYAKVLAARIYDYVCGYAQAGAGTFEAFTQDAQILLGKLGAEVDESTASKSWITRTKYRIQPVQVVNEKGRRIAIIFTRHSH